VGVAGQRQLRLELGFIELFALAEEEGVGGQEGWRRQSHQRRGGRHHQHVALAVADFVQGCQAFGHQVLVRRKRVVGQGFPVRQQVAGQLAVGEPGDFIEQALAVAGVRDDHGEHPFVCLQRQRRERQRIGIRRAVQRRQGEAVSGFREMFFEVERH
jgi:hypothetical protein